MLLALFVARIHCWVTLSLLSTKTRSLSLRAPCYQPVLLQRVFLSSVGLYICPCWVSLGLLAQCSSLSMSLWMATLPLTVLTWLTYWCICKSSEVVLCHWFKLDEHWTELVPAVHRLLLDSSYSMTHLWLSSKFRWFLSSAVEEQVKTGKLVMRPNVVEQLF